MSRVTGAILICNLLDEDKDLAVLSSVNTGLEEDARGQGFRLISCDAIGGYKCIGSTVFMAGFNHVANDSIEKAVRRARYPYGTWVMLLLQTEEDDHFQIVVRGQFVDHDRGTIWEKGPSLVDQP